MDNRLAAFERSIRWAVAGTVSGAAAGRPLSDYDFVGPAEDRKAAVDRAIEIWTNLWTAPQADIPELLIRDGQLDHEQFRSILSERDDSPVHLPE